MSKLLFNEQPLVIDKDLAALIGLNEAIVLQQIHYWLTINQNAKRNYFKGRYWTFNSVQEWQEQFPFWSYETVKRNLTKLRKSNILITDNFNELKIDRTLWYTINYDKLDSMKKDAESEKKTENVENSHWVNMTQCNRSNCSNALGHNDPMQRVTLTQPLPEITTEITKDLISQSINKEEGQIDRSNVKHIDKTFEEISKRLDIENVKSAYSQDIKLIEEIELIILDMYFSEYITIQGDRKPQTIVRKAITKLTYFHIEELISKYKELSTMTKIQNPKAYMQSMIYNIAFENELYVTNAVKYDLGY